jgi:hypothetical protein
MFLEEPHTTTKSYKILRGKVGTDIFAKGHKLEPYYVAAFAAYKLELQFRSQKVGTQYKSARYHILLALRLLLDPKPLPPMNSKEMEKRCNAMIELLSDQRKTDDLFREAIAVIDKVSKGDLSRDNIRTIATTEKIIEELRKP